MTTITIQDVTGGADIDVSDSSLIGKSPIRKLLGQGSDAIHALDQRLDQVKLTSAAFELDLDTPKIDLGNGCALVISPGISAGMKVLGSGDSPLLTSDVFTPEIDISDKQFWVNFELAATLKASVSAAAPNGFGIAAITQSATTFDVYTLFDGNNSPLPLFRDALAETLSSFGPLRSADDIRNQRAGTVNTCDVTGTVTVSGSWSLPSSINKMSFADTKVPITIDVAPSLTVKLKGSIAITGEFTVRSWKQTDGTLMFGVYKKKGSTFSVAFTAGGGMDVDAEGTDLIGAVLGAISPDIHTEVLGSDAAAIKKTLNDSIDRSLAISLNATCSASVCDESALIYQLDLGGDRASTDAALNAALRGDWTKLTLLPNATELRSVLRHSVEEKTKLCVNLLGVYNYSSVFDFVKSSTVLHCYDDASITVTDQSTAKRIAVSSTPYVADAKQLRKVLNECTVATAAYGFAKTGNRDQFKTKQTLVLYQEHMSAEDLRKALKTGAAMGIVKDEAIAAAMSGASSYQHVLIHAEQEVDADAGMNMFFYNTSQRTPRPLPELTALGRNVLLGFLDADDRNDQKRRDYLRSGWSDEAPPQDSVCRADWVTIQWWASAIHNVAQPLAAAMDAFAAIPAGSDPANFPDFQKKRKALADALAGVAKHDQAAFEQGWPLGVTYSIARGNTMASLRASWAGKEQINVARQSALTAAGS